MTRRTIASRVVVRRRYIRSVDLARDVDDPDALDGYVVTPSVRDATLRILAGLSAESRQRAFRIVGPYGVGKSAFGVFLAQLMRERGRGYATSLLSGVVKGAVDVAPWRPVIVSGRRVGFARELLRVVTAGCSEESVISDELKTNAESILERDSALDVQAVTALVTEMAAELRDRTGEGLLLLVDEMGRFLEHAAANMAIEDPSIFQTLAERSGGRAGANLAVVGFLHHRFGDYVAGMGGWIEAEWARSSERYEELSFGGSTEQSLFMLARALEPARRHTNAVRRRAEKIYGEAVDRGLFAVPREDVVQVAPNLYPLHPAAVAALALAIRRFGQNERSLFGFLQSLEPASLKRFAHSTFYDADNWYLVPSAFDHLATTISEIPGGDRMRRWSLAFDALAGAADLPRNHQEVLKAVALVAVLEPLPGLIADIGTIAWSLGIDDTQVQIILDELVKRNLIYRRPHRGDYSLWSSSSVDLSRWLEEAKAKVRVPERFEDISAILPSSRPAVAHRHYHATGTLRTFEVRLWTGENVGKRSADGLILVAPIYPDENRKEVLRNASAAVQDDPLALVCARMIAPEDLKWAHELALWSWVRENCEELKVDELARVEVGERIATAEQAMTRANALLSSTNSIREEKWWFAGKPINMPQGGLSALLSNICDKAYDQAPILKNELINRTKLSSPVASARMRLFDRMLTCADQAHLGLTGTPPERTIYLSLFQASGIHSSDSQGRFAFRAPESEHSHRWRPIWDRIAERLHGDESVSVSTLMEDLGAAPYGLRAGPALLIITAFVLASRDDIAIMERNSFQPDLTTAHLMRIAKSPRNFALKSLNEGMGQSGVIRALATRLQVIGTCRPTIAGISEKIFSWYNALPPHALKTTSLSAIAIVVRRVLRKASEPGRLFFHDLPVACDALEEDGTVAVEHFVETLDSTLLEIQDATPSLRARAVATAVHAFGVHDLPSLRSQIQEDYEPHRLELRDYRLRAFVERAMNTRASHDRWLDGIAGHLTGQRPDNWTDEILDKFDFEIRIVAGRLAKWLALARTRQTRSEDLRSVHVIGVDGREQMLVIRRDRPNPRLVTRLDAVREVLGSDPQAMEVLGQLLAEYADSHAKQFEEKEASRI